MKKINDEDVLFYSGIGFIILSIIGLCVGYVKFEEPPPFNLLTGIAGSLCGLFLGVFYLVVGIELRKERKRREEELKKKKEKWDQELKIMFDRPL